MIRNIETDIVIFGGGIAGLWLLNRLRQAGYSAIVLETGTLGGEQTHKSQGILHGGMKYALQGSLTASAKAVASAPSLWRACLQGAGSIDLQSVPILSATQHLWTTGSVAARVGGFLGSKLLQTEARHLSRDDFPEVFHHTDFKGHVYAFNEQVIDVHALIRALVKNQQDAIFQIDPLDAADLHYQSDGHLDSVTINAAPMPPVTVRARQFIFAAGRGNRLLLEAANNPAVRMQLRPLHMVMVKHSFPFPLYAHCLGKSAVPRLTITTHKTQDGKYIWYLGGRLSEEGASRSPAEQTAKARSELNALFPWLDFSTAEFASFFVDRAEMEQSGGSRPDSFSVNTGANYLVAWPTKLVLAPLLAEDILNRLNQTPYKTGRSDLRALRTWPIPPFSRPMWEQLF